MHLWAWLCLFWLLTLPAHAEPPAWSVERTGQPLATVTPNRETTLAELARLVSLNPDEATDWLTAARVDGQPPGLAITPTLALSPESAKPYRLAVPNTLVVELGSATPWRPPRHLVAFRFLAMAHDLKRDAQRRGYHVVLISDADADRTRRSLHDNTANRTLARYAFFGHGDAGIINTTGEPDQGLMPNRYVSYGLAGMNLHACGSLAPAAAALPFLNPRGQTGRLPPATASMWRYNVAPQGRLVGYLHAEVGAFNAQQTLTQPGLIPPPWLPVAHPPHPQ